MSSKEGVSAFRATVPAASRIFYLQFGVGGVVCPIAIHLSLLRLAAVCECCVKYCLARKLRNTFYNADKIYLKQLFGGALRNVRCLISNDCKIALTWTILIETFGSEIIISGWPCIIWMIFNRLV